MTILLLTPILLQAQYSTNARYYESPGEYQMAFKVNYLTPGLGYTVTTDSSIAGTGNVGPQGVPHEIVTNQTHKMMAIACAGLHDGGFVSADSGRVFMYGLPTNCQLGNGLTTGPSTTYEILTDVNGNPFYNVNAMTAGWGPVSAVPFYAFTKTGGGDTVWAEGNLTNLGGSSCAKPTPMIVSVGRTVWKIYAMNSFLHVICTDGTLWVRGGTDDNAANSGINSNPTTFTQVTGIPPVIMLAKGNGFVFAVTSTRDSLIAFGQLGWLCKNGATSPFGPLTTPTVVNSFFPSTIFPIDTMVAAHVGYAILNTSNGLFTGGSNEVGICGTGPTLFWPTYTGSNGFAPWAWDFGMGEYVNQCTQICKGANVVWSKLFGGALYSLYILAQDTAGHRIGIGRGKVFPDGVIWADKIGGRISATYPMGHNLLYASLLPDYFSITAGSIIIASCPGCADGNLTGTPCTYGTDAPLRPNTNLNCNLVLTPIAGGFNWSISTSTTDASHSIMPTHSFIVQSGGASIPLGIPAGQSGSILAPPGTYSITDTMVDNSFDTVTATQSVTVPGQTGFYINSSTGSGTACTFASPGPVSYLSTLIPTLLPGDTLYLARGGNYGQLSIAVSGLSGAHIVIRPYGSGLQPIVGGNTALSFSSAGSNLWTASYSGVLPPNFLLQNGVIMPISNSGMMTYTPASSTTTSLFVGANASLAPIGTRIVVWSSSFIIDTTVVTGQTSTTLTVSPALTIMNPAGDVAIGWEIWHSTPSVQNQWNYNNGTITVFSTTTPTGWTAPIYDTVAYVTGQYIDFDSLTFTGGNTALVYAAFQTASGPTLNNDSLIGAYDGFFSRGASFVTMNNTVIEQCTDEAVFKESVSYHWNINNCTWKYIGMNAGMGGPGGGGRYSGINIVQGDSAISVTHGVIDSIGYCGIQISGSSSAASYNIVGHTLLLKGDGAGIYTWIPSGTTYAGSSIDSNYVYNVPGAITLAATPGSATVNCGIYLDAATNHTNAVGNTVDSVGTGLYDHGSNNSFLNNTVHNPSAQGIWAQELSGQPITGLVVTGNIVDGVVSGSNVIALTTPNNDLNTFGTINNNHYAHSVNATPFLKINSVGNSSLSLAGWISTLGYDASSTFLLKALTFYGNPTASTSNISIPILSSDLLGSTYSGAVTLQPRSGLLVYQIGCNCIPIPVGARILVN